MKDTKKKLTKAKLKKLEKRELKKKDLEWQKSIKERDGAKCVICGRTDRINVHHLIPREIKSFRHDIDNGICLCNLHHKFSLEISPHRNPIIFIDWLIMNGRDKQLKDILFKYKIWKDTQE